MEEALTNSKTTTDPIEQAMQWIKAEEEKRALQKLKETLHAVEDKLDIVTELLTSDKNSNN